MKKPLDRFRSFHRDDSAQIAFIMIFGAVAFVALLGMVVTTGDYASLKIQAQNAADAAALSGGAWIARGLNLTSALNVMQTQLVGGAILLNAFSETLKISIPIVNAMCIGYTACAATVLGFPICIVPKMITCFQARHLLPRLSNMIGSLASAAKCPSGLFWTTAKALEHVNGMIRNGFYLIAAFEANAVAKANQSEIAAFLPGPLFHAGFSSNPLLLPTKEGNFTDLCSPMTVGSPTRDERGYFKLLTYPVGQGPYTLGECRLWWATTLVTGFPPVGWVLFPALTKKQHDMLCGGTSWMPFTTVIKRQAKNLAECEMLGGKADWTRSRITTELMVATDACGWFAGNFTRENQPDVNHPEIASMTTDEIKDRSCSWRPPGTRLREGEYCHLTGSAPVKVSDDPARWEYRHTLEVWALGRTEVKEKKKIETNPLGGACGDHKPNPYLLVDEKDALRFVVFAERPNRRLPFFSKRFLERQQELITYAQVEVYNGISHDTFTQDWRVRLERASLLERPFQALGDTRFMEVGHRILTGYGWDHWKFAGAFHEINNH